MRHKISILIPTYNVEKYLKKCLDSALAQTYSNYEVVIVDDGSTDNTINIIEKYAKCFPCISYKSIKHAGVSVARNHLLSENRGDYLFFLDADDYILPDTLQILYDTAVQFHAEIVQCEMEMTSKCCIEEEPCNGVMVLTREEALRAYNRTLQGPRCMVWGKLYKRDMFENISFPEDGRPFEDEYTAFLLLNNCNVFVAVHKIMYAYYSNPESIMRKTFNLDRYYVLQAVQNSICFFWNLKMMKQVYRIQFRYLTLLRMLYTETAKELPHEKCLMEKLMREYKELLPEVLANLKLPDMLVDDFKTWPNNPLTIDSYNYWEYVRGGVLPA